MQHDYMLKLWLVYMSIKYDSNFNWVLKIGHNYISKSSQFALVKSWKYNIALLQEYYLSAWRSHIYIYIRNGWNNTYK